MTGGTPSSGAAGGVKGTWWTTFAVGCLVACGGPSGSPGPLRLEAMPSGRDTRLTLVAAPGFKLNARLKPALELSDGTVVRFDSPVLTPDSAYFAEPPSALVAGRHDRIHGRVRASVCDPGATVCRTVEFEL